MAITFFPPDDLLLQYLVGLQYFGRITKIATLQTLLYLTLRRLPFSQWRLQYLPLPIFTALSPTWMAARKVWESVHMAGIIAVSTDTGMSRDGANESRIV